MDLPCIEAPGARDKYGYGKCRRVIFGKRMWAAHIAAWAEANGRLPGPGMSIRHTCDNPPCIEPSHLVEGTQKDNMADRHDRGRHYNQVKTCCPKCGGPFEEVKTAKGTARRCRPCATVRRAEYARERRLRGREHQ